MQVTCPISLCHPCGPGHHQVHQDLVIRAHPSLQLGQLLVHLFDLVDQANLARLAHRLSRAVHGRPVTQTASVQCGDHK